MTIYEKLAKIRGLVSHIQNDAKGYGYRYTSDEAILSRIQDEMEKQHISLIPAIVPGTTHVVRHEAREQKEDKDGNPYEKLSIDYVTTADMTYRWVNDTDPSEYVEVAWSLVGIQSSASQSFGSGLTYSMRYFLLKFFNIATSDDDPDAYLTKQQASAKKQKSIDDKKESAAINEKTAELIQTILLKQPDARENMLNTCRKFVKRATKQDDPNYHKIEDPVVAQALYDELKKVYGGKE